MEVTGYLKRPSTTASAALVLHDVLDAHGSPAAYGLRELGRELFDEHLSEDLDLDGAEAWEETTASFSLLAAVRGGDGARSARARTRADRAARLELAELFVREQPERRVTVLEEPAELEVLRRRHAPHPRIDHAPLPGDEECGSHGAPQESFDAVVLAMELTPPHGRACAAAAGRAPTDDFASSWPRTGTRWSPAATWAGAGSSTRGTPRARPAAPAEHRTSPDR